MIIEVFLIKERKSYYFGSLAAVFSVYKPEDIGFTLSYLQHANLGGTESHYQTLQGHYHATHEIASID